MMNAARLPFGTLNLGEDAAAARAKASTKKQLAQPAPQPNQQPDMLSTKDNRGHRGEEEDASSSPLPPLPSTPGDTAATASAPTPPSSLPNEEPQPKLNLNNAQPSWNDIGEQLERAGFPTIQSIKVERDPTLAALTIFDHANGAKVTDKKLLFPFYFSSPSPSPISLLPSTVSHLPSLHSPFSRSTS